MRSFNTKQRLFFFQKNFIIENTHLVEKFSIFRLYIMKIDAFKEF